MAARPVTLRDRAVPAVAAITATIVVWWILAIVAGPQRGIPAPGDVVSWWFGHRSTILDHARQTASVSAMGFAIGNLAAVVVAITVFFVRVLERPALAVAIATYCLPLIAIGPLLQITLGGNTPEIVLAALAVFFTTLVGVLSGLRSTAQTSIDVIRAFGGDKVAELRYVRAQTGASALIVSLALAAPAAVLGALLGEFLGGDSGLGVALVNAQKIGDAPRAWAYGLTAAALAGVATAAVSLMARIFVPWQRIEETNAL